MLKLILFIFISKSFCNIWDNMFSQQRSPQYVIPDEFIMYLNNTNGNNLLQVMCSAKLDFIKVSLIMEKINILNVLINFQNSTFSLDFPSNCSYTNLTVVDNLSLKFFLSSYDLITFYRNNTSIKKHEYIITDILKGGENLKFLHENKINGMIKEIVSNVLKVFDDKIDEEAYAVFKMNYSNHLETIDFKYKGINYKNFMVSTNVTKLNETDFKLRHNCSYFNGTY